MLPSHRLLSRLLVTVGASVAAVAACSTSSSSNGGEAGNLSMAGSSNAGGSSGSAGSASVACEAADDPCTVPPSTPGCCLVVCYPAVDDPPYPLSSCIEVPDAGYVDTDGGVADAAAGECLPASDPQTAALLGAGCQAPRRPLREGVLTSDAGAPVCCYPTSVGWTGRPLPIAGESRVAKLRPTAAWC